MYDVTHILVFIARAPRGDRNRSCKYQVDRSIHGVVYGCQATKQRGHRSQYAIRGGDRSNLCI
jgi:hypothetical protein